MPGMPQNVPSRFPPQPMGGSVRGGPQQGFPQQQVGRGGGPPAQGPRGGQGNYKLNSNIRNAPEPQQPSPAGPVITAAALASAGPAEQKQMLGEALYPRIHETVPALAGVSV